METYGSPEGYMFNLQTCSSSEAKRMWRESIKQDWDHECAYCGSKENITLDHIVPKAKGGNTHRDNLCACCLSCNGLKGHDDWIIWYIQQPFFTEERRQRIEDWMAPGIINDNIITYPTRRNVSY